MIEKIVDRLKGDLPKLPGEEITVVGLKFLIRDAYHTRKLSDVVVKRIAGKLVDGGVLEVCGEKWKVIINGNAKPTETAEIGGNLDSCETGG